MALIKYITSLYQRHPEFFIKVISRYYPFSKKMLSRYGNELIWEDLSFTSAPFFSPSIIPSQITPPVNQKHLHLATLYTHTYDMDGIPTSIFVQYFPETDGFHYFSYPDTPECIAWFTKLFDSLVDIYHKRKYKPNESSSE